MPSLRLAEKAIEISLSSLHYNYSTICNADKKQGLITKLLKQFLSSSLVRAPVYRYLFSLSHCSMCRDPDLFWLVRWLLSTATHII